MKTLIRAAAAAAFACLLAPSALAQNAGTVTNHAFPIGKGVGQQGYTSLLCGSAQLAVGQAAADPICRTLSGDVTLSAAGVTVLGNIPSATTLAGSLLATAIAAPSTPAAGKDSVWVDSTDKRLHDKNDAGTIGTTVVASTASTHQFATSVSAAGVLGYTQPSFADLLSSLACSQAPALTGDVTTSAGVCATTIANSAVTSAKMANMAAFTLKGNATGSSAAPTDISVPALTQKASPVAGDILLLFDSAASNAMKFALVSSVASAGSVASIAGNTGAFTLTKGLTNTVNAIGRALNEATLQASPTNPTATSSTTAVMAGMGGTLTLTPAYSTRVRVFCQGAFFSSTSTASIGMQLRWGTGVAPSNGAAVTGTALGTNINSSTFASNSPTIFSLGGIVTGLSPGTANWYDIAFFTSNAANAANLANISCALVEF